MALLATLWLMSRAAASDGAGPSLPVVALPQSAELSMLRVATTDELEQLFDSIGYHWPPRSPADVPNVILASLPEDFAASEDVVRKKGLFWRTLLPIARLENERLREQRQLVEFFFKTGVPDPQSDAGVWLQALAERYEVGGDLTDPAEQVTLLRRLDEVPVALVLAQAAIESGWGGSRFALEGNSLFGQYTYSEKHGLVPAERAPEAGFLVRRYQSLRDSVRSYMRNLNTHPAYLAFRATREAMRVRGKPLDAVQLAQGLERYSERGQDYVQDVHAIMHKNGLTELTL